MTIKTNPGQAAVGRHGTGSAKGALASKKGKGMSFAQIRKAAASAARRQRGK